MYDLHYSPGPWAWFGNSEVDSFYLATVGGGRKYVMDFARLGMQRAQPRFQPPGGIMVGAKELCEYEVGDGKAVGHEAARNDGTVYRYDVCGIDHPDARLIMLSPELCKLVEAVADAASTNCEDFQAHYGFSKSEIPAKAAELLARVAGKPITHTSHEHDQQQV